MPPDITVKLPPISVPTKQSDIELLNKVITDNHRSQQESNQRITDTILNKLRQPTARNRTQTPIIGDHVYRSRKQYNRTQPSVPILPSITQHSPYIQPSISNDIPVNTSKQHIPDPIVESKISEYYKCINYITQRTKSYVYSVDPLEQQKQQINEWVLLGFDNDEIQQLLQQQLIHHNTLYQSKRHVSELLSNINTYSIADMLSAIYQHAIGVCNLVDTRKLIAIELSHTQTSSHINNMYDVIDDAVCRYEENTINTQQHCKSLAMEQIMSFNQLHKSSQQVIESTIPVKLIDDSHIVSFVPISPHDTVQAELNTAYTELQSVYTKQQNILNMYHDNIRIQQTRLSNIKLQQHEQNTLHENITRVTNDCIQMNSYCELLHQQINDAHNNIDLHRIIPHMSNISTQTIDMDEHELLVQIESIQQQNNILLNDIQQCNKHMLDIHTEQQSNTTPTSTQPTIPSKTTSRLQRNPVAQKNILSYVTTDDSELSHTEIASLLNTKHDVIPQIIKYRQRNTHQRFDSTDSIDHSIYSTTMTSTNNALQPTPASVVSAYNTLIELESYDELLAEQQSVIDEYNRYVDELKLYDNIPDQLLNAQRRSVVLQQVVGALENKLNSVNSGDINIDSDNNNDSQCSMSQDSMVTASDQEYITGSNITTRSLPISTFISSAASQLSDQPASVIQQLQQHPLIATATTHLINQQKFNDKLIDTKLKLSNEIHIQHIVNRLAQPRLPLIINPVSMEPQIAVDSTLPRNESVPDLFRINPVKAIHTTTATAAEQPTEHIQTNSIKSHHRSQSAVESTTYTAANPDAINNNTQSTTPLHKLYSHSTAVDSTERAKQIQSFVLNGSAVLNTTKTNYT